MVGGKSVACAPRTFDTEQQARDSGAFFLRALRRSPKTALVAYRPPETYNPNFKG